MPAFETDFLVLLYDVARQMRTRADQRARARGMTRAQWMILKRLDRQPGDGDGLDLDDAGKLVLGQARLVDRLEARGLVERQADPADRRVWRLHLKPAATPILAEIDDYRIELRAQMTAGIDAKTLEAVTEVLVRMKANLAGETRAVDKAV